MAELKERPVRVLVVDDSKFFRRRITETLSADNAIEVVGTAENGAQALEEALRLRPNVITMDVEMPVMDGIAAVRQIMAKCPTPILMFSSLTTEGAQATLDALDAGAMDFLPKRFEDIAPNRQDAQRILCSRVRALGAKRQGAPRVGAASPAPATRHKPVAPSASAARRSAVPVAVPRAKADAYRVVVIGASTGGPAALQQILKSLPADFPLPLLLIQHMPAAFTGPYAQRLDKICGITVKEAADGDCLTPGVALLAPGGRQMELVDVRGRVSVRIMEGPTEQIHKPSVNVCFSSVARVHGGSVLAIVLTGMGSDGCDGATLLREAGATIWAQDEQSSVVFGMPRAVVVAGLADKILPLDKISDELLREIR